MTETLNMIIIKLAEYFDVSVKFLQAHFMEYVLEYGKYKLISNMWTDLIFYIFIGAIISLFSVGILYWITEDDYSDNDFFCKHKKKIVIAAVGIFATVSIFPVIYNLTMYKVSPEIYSLKQIQQDFIGDERCQ